MKLPKLITGACKVVIHDGGRKDAGFKGVVQDCAVRSAAIALELSYRHVWDAMRGALPKRSSVHGGVYKEDFDRFLFAHGCLWIPVMGIGTGVLMHLRTCEVPPGRVIARVSGHFCAIVDRVIFDNHDPTRNGTRCVYGYWETGK